MDEGGLAAQETFLVRIQNADQGNFGKIETFTKQIDSDENVEIGCAKAAQDFDALDRVDVAMQVAHFQSDISQVIGQIFGGSFRQCRYQYSLAFFHTLTAKFDRIIDLMLQRL